MAFNVALGFLAGVIAGPVAAGSQGLRRTRPSADGPETEGVESPVESPAAVGDGEPEYTTLAEFMKESVR
jgi:hypothetical protein